jgi:hypothetical protein
MSALLRFFLCFKCPSCCTIKKNIEEGENKGEKKLVDGKEMPRVRQKERKNRTSIFGKSKGKYSSNRVKWRRLRKIWRKSERKEEEMEGEKVGMKRGGRKASDGKRLETWRGDGG